MADSTQACKTCGKQFLVIEKEQAFLTERGLPFPANCPACRQTRRLRLRGDRALFKAKCSKCQKVIIVTYDPTNVANQILCRPDYDQYFVENDPIIAEPLPQA